VKYFTNFLAERGEGVLFSWGTGQTDFVFASSSSGLLGRRVENFWKKTIDG
jgi:hypothetical protein